MDFDVGGSPIVIEQLGAFDSNQDGFSGQIAVGIFNRDTQQLVGTSTVLSGTNQSLAGNSRFSDVADFTLQAGGRYSIVVVGFGASGADPYGERFNPTAGPAPTVNTGGGLISFVGTGRYTAPGAGLVYPNLVDNGPANRFDAGTFVFAPVPEPHEWAMMLAGMGFIGWRVRQVGRGGLGQSGI